MAKNIVICCDGTGNQVQGNLSNVLKLFRIVEKSPAQRVYYHPGIGTIGSDDRWTEIKQNAKAVFDLATGHGLDDDILGTYRFVAEQFEEGDNIFLFGFSRGAYTVRALAGFLHMVGLLPADQLNIANYALTSYKKSSEIGDFELAWNFGNVTGARTVMIKFVGVWDTVASVLVPRPDRLFPTMLTLPYTRTNPSVEVFRHAMAIDERRRMFRLNRWVEPQPFVANPFDRTAPSRLQDVKQVWFAGVHGDVGGGYPELESGLSKFPLAWMIEQAVAHGLKIDVAMKNHLVLGEPRVGSRHSYVAPDAGAELHNSMTAAWRLLEWPPKSMKWNEWPRPHLFGYYLPDAEPRMIANDTVKPRLHASVVARQAEIEYRPPNLPTDFDIEPFAAGSAV
jgi:uncharacterized protein (DUF2235 family)